MPFWFVVSKSFNTQGTLLSKKENWGAAVNGLLNVSYRSLRTKYSQGWIWHFCLNMNSGGCQGFNGPVPLPFLIISIAMNVAQIYWKIY
jgi:hypothetical protein